MTDAPEPRLAPLPSDEWDDDVLAALHRAFPDKIVDRFVTEGAPTAIGTMLHHPALAGPWLEYNNVLLWEPALDHRLRELMVLRVAHRTGSVYEWGQHVRLAQRYGVTDDDVAAIASAQVDRSRFTPLEATLLRATDELLEDSRVSDATWARLAEHLDARQLVEVVFVVGTYTCLAMVFNSFGLVLDPEV